MVFIVNEESFFFLLLWYKIPNFPDSKNSEGPQGQSLDIIKVLFKAASIKTAPGSSHNEDKIKAEEMSQRWVPYRCVATWYFWRSLDPITVEY